MPARPTYSPMTPHDDTEHASNPNVYPDDSFVSTLPQTMRLVKLREGNNSDFALFSFFAWLRVPGCSHVSWVLCRLSSRLVPTIYTLYSRPFPLIIHTLFNSLLFAAAATHSSPSPSIPPPTLRDIPSTDYSTVVPE